MYEPGDGLPKLALQLVPTRQALLNILTVALDWLETGRLVVRAEHQTGDRHVSLSVSGYGALAAAAALRLGAERLSVARELLSFSGGSLHHDADRGRRSSLSISPHAADRQSDYRAGHR